MPASKPTPSLLIAIVAMDENGVIGKNNQLPWHLPADLKHFKSLTSGHPILMGRKTYESIGKPLPNRTNIILSRNPNLTIPGCRVVQTVEQALKWLEDAPSLEKAFPKKIFIIGGAEIYQQLMPLTKRLHLTVVHHTFSGDTFFPKLDEKEWLETERTDHCADESNPYPYSFVTLNKR